MEICHSPIECSQCGYINERNAIALTKKFESFSDLTDEFFEKLDDYTVFFFCRNCPHYEFYRPVNLQRSNKGACNG
jgi:hypothetical protein